MGPFQKDYTSVNTDLRAIKVLNTYDLVWVSRRCIQEGSFQYVVFPLLTSPFLTNWGEYHGRVGHLGGRKLFLET